MQNIRKLYENNLIQKLYRMKEENTGNQ